MSARSVTPRSSDIPVDSPSFGFPKSFRILKRSDFRKVYDEGTRYTCPYFAAFYSVWEEQVDGPKVGFTVSKAMGNAVVRNRMKRRMREAVRLHLSALPTRFAIVFNPRKPLLAAKAPAIELEVERLFRKCANS